MYNNDTYLRYRTKYCHCPKNPLCPAYSSLSTSIPSPPKGLATADLFIISLVLRFPEYHTVGTIQYVAFSDWLLSLNNMHLSFFHVFLWFDSSFLFITE